MKYLEAQIATGNPQVLSDWKYFLNPKFGHESEPPQFDPRDDPNYIPGCWPGY